MWISLHYILSWLIIILLLETWAKLCSSNWEQNSKENKRLEILNHSNDGFYIAEKDLELRGPGDFFGIRQSGEMDFMIADIYKDAELLKEASDEINRLKEYKYDPESSQYQWIQKMIQL